MICIYFLRVIRFPHRYLAAYTERCFHAIRLRQNWASGNCARKEFQTSMPDNRNELNWKTHENATYRTRTSPQWRPIRKTVLECIRCAMHSLMHLPLCCIRFAIDGLRGVALCSKFNIFRTRTCELFESNRQPETAGGTLCSVLSDHFILHASIYDSKLIAVSEFELYLPELLLTECHENQYENYNEYSEPNVIQFHMTDSNWIMIWI